MKDRLARPAVAILCGGWAAVWTSLEVRLFLLAFFALMLFRLWLIWKPEDFYGRIVKPEILLLIAGVIAGFIYGMPADKYIAEPLNLTNIEAEGKLIHWQIDQDLLRGTFEIQNLKLATEKAKDTVESQISAADFSGKKYILRVYPNSEGHWAQGWLKVKPGDTLKLSGKLEQPKPPGTAGEFDFTLYNAVRGLSGSITARGDVTVLVEGKATFTWVLRQQLRDTLNSYWPEQTGVLEGILFGDDSGIPKEVLDMYKATGVMHVFAASGANVAFVLALGWAAFFFLPKKLRILATMVVIILYAILCQGNPPILRATILGLAVLFGMLGKGRISALRWLIFAALLLFFINPLYLRDTSFLLSFAATWGMIVLAPKIQKNDWIRKLPQPLQTALAVTLAAQIATFPLLIDVFHRVSLIGLLTNVFILFVLGAVLQLGLVGTALLWLPILPLAFFQAACWLLQISDLILNFCARLPFAYYWVLNPGWVFWLLWYSYLAVMLLGKEKVWFIARVQFRRLRNFGKKLLTNVFGQQLGQKTVSFRKFQTKILNFKGLRLFFKLAVSKNIGLISAIVLILALLLLPTVGKDRLVVTFIDVGQGDCILLETRTEKLLVDTGPKSGNFDAGERVLVPYLMEKRIASLDMLFLSHEDGDHVGGAPYLIANIPTARVAVPEVGDRLNSEEWREAIPLKSLADAGKLLRLKAGDRLLFNSGLEVEVLAPVEVLEGTPSDSNNNSLVLLLTYNNRKILLTGDMEIEQMRRIADRGAKWDADFIKIPHHGSAGSLDPYWFDQTNPQAVFIQVGRNSFGHPTSKVLQYWQERDIPVYRTDLHGTVSLVIDRKGCSIVPGRTNL
ncbi:MAG: DNA internalization-related competence protein ComEC/Rec2 [Peptococcaceae bacterium]|jgi:competence protein ComEC|nr:DNA internalization-related competence protein ComEC/Rec2 [Peptococcaceae bacterium]